MLRHISIRVQNQTGDTRWSGTHLLDEYFSKSTNSDKISNIHTSLKFSLWIKVQQWLAMKNRRTDHPISSKQRPQISQRWHVGHTCQSSSCGRTAGQCAVTHIVMSLGPTCRRPKGFNFWRETSAVSPQNSQQLCLPKASDLLDQVAKAHKQATGVKQNKTKNRHI